MSDKNGVQKGFTLIELIAVMVLASAIFIVLGNTIGTSTFTVQASRDDLVAALFYAQQIAMARGSASNPVQFIADASTNTIEVRENGTSLTNYPLTLPNGVTITSGDVTLNYDKLGRTDVSSDTLITLAGGGAAATVRVAPTGYAYY